MRILGVVILLFSLNSLGISQADAVTDSYKAMEFTTDRGFTLPYRYISPASMERGIKYPLVIMLHGAGERGDDNMKQLTHGADLFLTPENRSDYASFVIFPQCSAESYWSSVEKDRGSYPLKLNFDYNNQEITEDLEAVMLLTKDLTKKLPIDRKRIYIVGLSMGGMGTFEMIHRYPKCFAAAMPICGGGDIINYTKKAKKVPFWVFHGDADVVVQVEESRRMIEALKELGYDVNYSEYPDVNHNSWESAFAEPDFFKWMFSKRR